MQKMLIAAGAFVIGATLGMGLFVMALLVTAYVSMKHSGGSTALAGVIHHWTVAVVPVVCGCVAAWMAMRRLNRIQR
jgi:hypothetical protein